jgi:hypothetical protein
MVRVSLWQHHTRQRHLPIIKSWVNYTEKTCLQGSLQKPQHDVHPCNSVISTVEQLDVNRQINLELYVIPQNRVEADEDLDGSDIYCTSQLLTIVYLSLATTIRIDH